MVDLRTLSLAILQPAIHRRLYPYAVWPLRRGSRSKTSAEVFLKSGFSGCLVEPQPVATMTLKRGADTAEGPESKRSRCDSPSSAWTSCENVPSLTDLDLAVQQTDVFLKRIGVCAGVHSASDVQCRESNNSHSLLGTNQDWQGLTEHTW